MAALKSLLFLQLVLQAETTSVVLDGVVTGTDGAPLAEARVDIATAAPRVGRGMFCPSCYRDCAKWTLTDARGRFTIAGLDPSLKFRLLCTAPDRQATLTPLIDPRDGPASIQLAAAPTDLPPERTVLGQIVDADGQPIRYALVEPEGAKVGSRRWWGLVQGVQSTVSDAKGRFAMLLPENMQGVDLEITADGYAGASVSLVKPGVKEHRIVVPSGTRVVGRLVHEAQPVAGLRIAVVQIDRSAGRHFVKAVEAITDSQGRFLFEHLPAEEAYAIFTPVNGNNSGLVLTTKRFMAHGNSQERDLGALSPVPDLHLGGRLELPAGARLPPNSKLTFGRDPAWDLVVAEVAEDGRFELRGLPPESYEVHLGVEGFGLDLSRLAYQPLRPNSFGLPMKASLTDVRIPLRAAAPAPKDEPSADPLSCEVASDEPIVTTQAQKPPVTRTLEPTPAGGPALRVRGQVLDPAGRPVPGAQVALRANIGGSYYSGGVLHNRDLLARTRTDASGRFEFDQIGIPLRFAELISQLAEGRGKAQLLAWAEGFGLAWANVRRLETEDDVQLTLTEESPVEGVVRDSAGKPLSGVQLQVWGATRARSEYDAFLSAPGDLSLSLSQLSFGGETDAEGKFRLSHLPADYRLPLVVKRPGFERQVLMIDTARQSDLKHMRAIGGGSTTSPVVRSPVVIELKPANFVAVRVTQHDGRPVPSGAVEAIDAQRHMAGWEAVDPQGIARISIGQPGRYSFHYSADPLAPSLAKTVSAEVTAADQAQTVEIRLPEPRWLTGRVLDADSRAPVAGAYIYYASPGQAGGDRPVASSMSVSGVDGSFRLPVIAGPGSLNFQHSLFGYVTARSFERGKPTTPAAQIQIPAEGQVEPVELVIARGLAIRGTVRDSQGKPVAGAIVRGHTEEPHYVSIATRSDANGRYELYGFPPREEVHLSVAHALGGAERSFTGEPEHPWNKTRWAEFDARLAEGVTLAGCVARDGRPQRGVQLRLYRAIKGQEQRFRLFGEDETDADGRYAISGLAAGDQYYFEIEAADGTSAPDWTHQTPYIQTVDEQAGIVELPEANLVTRNQTLRGVVVDPQGRPVAGVTVSASLAGGHGLSHRAGSAPPFTDTDAQGRFELRQLPGKQIELMVYRRNPKGGPIRFPSRVRPARGQADVRIVFDPSLTSDVEDLDGAARKPDKR